MLFNSYEFIFVFLPVTFFVYFYLNHKRLTGAAKGFLVLSSLVFYSWWNIAYLPLILASMLFNYTTGNILSGYREGSGNRFSRKQVLAAGIVANLALLGYFKYTDFFIENFNLVTGSGVGLLHLALPLAISFFTFQQIAYLVDSYRQETQEYDFVNYAVFVTFFPQLIAGPIVHHKEMMPQFASNRTKIINYRNISAGLFIFSVGLFKKVIIADSFAVWATAGFDGTAPLNLIEAWATSFSYTFQLYFDFSGYTDMAIGLALLFNIRLPVNFDSPYKASSIQDFWRRWHITLSRFLRDYIYIPLGGNRKGSFRTYTNLMATFVLGGIWHGAGWTFVFWGFLHGLALVIHRLWAGMGFRLWTWLGWLLTFNFVNIAWIFFRAKEWDDATRVLGSMFSLDNMTLPYQLESSLPVLKQFGVGFGIILGSNRVFLHMVLMMFFAVAIVWYRTNSNDRVRLDIYSVFFMSVVFTYSLYNINQVSEFLYFNF